MSLITSFIYFDFTNKMQMDTTSIFFFFYCTILAPFYTNLQFYVWYDFNIFNISTV